MSNKIIQHLFEMCLTILMVTAGIFTFVGFSLAAGGGGGGSTSGTVCDEDSWGCTDWGACSADGTQERECVLTFDCPFTDTPKPAESQGCTLPCSEDVWECTDWNECAATADQTRTCTLVNDCEFAETPKPQEIQTCSPSPETMEAARAGVKKPEFETETGSTAEAPDRNQENCQVDTWECGPWQKCNRDGEQRRSCNKTFDCLSADTEIPPVMRVCQEVQCGNLETLRERVNCRLNLSQKGLARELSLQYLPEECRFSPAGSQSRNACMELYKSYQPCWKLPTGLARHECAAEVLEYPNDIAAEAVACRRRFEPEACLGRLRQKVYKMVKFHFYDLEIRAENLIDYGADRALVGEFVSSIYEKKNEFNLAEDKAEHRRIVLEVRNLWQEFVRAVKGSVGVVDESLPTRRTTAY